MEHDTGQSRICTHRSERIFSRGVGGGCVEFMQAIGDVDVFAGLCLPRGI